MALSQDELPVLVFGNGATAWAHRLRLRIGTTLEGIPTQTLLIEPTGDTIKHYNLKEVLDSKNQMEITIIRNEIVELSGDTGRRFHLIIPDPLGQPTPLSDRESFLQNQIKHLWRENQNLKLENDRLNQDLERMKLRQLEDDLLTVERMKPLKEILGSTFIDGKSSGAEAPKRGFDPS